VLRQIPRTSIGISSIYIKAQNGEIACERHHLPM
jgi:hypothetical protein